MKGIEKAKKFVKAHRTLVYGIVMFAAGAMLVNRIHISKSDNWNIFDEGKIGGIGVRKSEYAKKAVDIVIKEEGNDSIETMITLKNKDAIDFAKKITKQAKK